MHCDAATYTYEDVLATRFRTEEMLEMEAVRKLLDNVVARKENAFCGESRKFEKEEVMKEYGRKQVKW